jgi:energy-converting hydrogenase A subunit M
MLGDNSMRLFELDLSAPLPTSGESFIQAVSNTSITAGGVGNDVTRGACVLPKQVNDYKSCEIIRVLKLTDDMVQPISVILPRVDRSKIHELYPDTLDLAAPTVTCQQWRDGSDIELTRVKLNVIDILSNKVIDSSIYSTTSTFETAVESIDLEGRRDNSNSTRTSSKRFSNLNSSLKFRHMFGTESVKEFSFYNLQPDLSATDSPIIACSDTCFALPYKGGGGPVFISVIDSFGKVKADSTSYVNGDSPSSNILVNAHKAPVQDIAFSSFHDSIMATGSADSTVIVYSSSCNC